jgi:hypothetical protein
MSFARCAQQRVLDAQLNDAKPMIEVQSWFRAVCRDTVLVLTTGVLVSLLPLIDGVYNFKITGNGVAYICELYQRECLFAL